MKARISIVSIPVLALLMAALAFGQAFAEDEGPQETLREPLNEVISILEDPRYQDESKKDEQYKKLRETIDSVFNFTEMSKRTLARNWRDFSIEQRREFRDLFKEFLGDIYLSKIQGNFSGEKVVFESAHQLTDQKAVVKTRIVQADKEIPVDYSMIDKSGKGEWEVYDVTVENVSLVQNYRSQFSKILRRGKPEELITRLRKKVSADDDKDNEDMSEQDGTEDEGLEKESSGAGNNGDESR